MATPPDGLTIEHDRDHGGREKRPLARRIILAALALFLLLALLNVFGQRPSSVTARSDAAALEVHAPASLRGGLLFEARLHVKAIRELRDATVVLDTGWLESMTLNTIEPSPIG